MSETTFRNAFQLLASWGGASPFQEMLEVVLLKAEAHYHSHPQWPVLYLPEVIGAAFGLPDDAIEQLAIANLLFFCFADVTDDAEDHDLSEAWAEWGWPQAVNTGNALLFGCIQHLSQHFPPETAWRLVDLYARTGLEMTKGQQLDLFNGLPRRISLEEYLACVKGKSGASLSAFAAAPAIVARCDSLIEPLATFGEHLGMVIQLISDVREAWSSGGPDLCNGRLSLPALYLLETASPEEERALLELFQESAKTGEGTRLRAKLDQPRVRMYVEMRVELLRRNARAALEAFPDASLRSTLETLLDIPTFLAPTPLI